MNFKYKLRLVLWKSYFDRGNALANYLLYLIGFFGLASRDVKTTLILAVLYAIGCFFLGWAWTRFKWLSAEIEVSNRFNPFVKEMRKSIHRKV